MPIGSSGDVHPFVGLAGALEARGHHVTFVVCGYFRELVERAGLEYVELGTREEFLSALDHPDLWHPRRAFGHVFRLAAQTLRRQYHLIAERSGAGEIVVLTSLLGCGARLAQEKLGVPLVTVDCQPSCIWSACDPPVLPGIPLQEQTPRWLRSFIYRLGERFVIDPVACPELNRFRRELGLPPIQGLTRWWHSPDATLCLFPEWFAAPQPDWPPNVRLAEFPLWDEASLRDPQPEVEEFLASGDAPLVFTPGSANTQAQSFFRAAVEACRRLGRRGILLTRFFAQVPRALPAGVRHFDYVPLSRVLPRAAAIVHHGGIGTTAQALRAGIPQLIMPLAHDQPDNAARLRRLGVGDLVKPAAFRGPRVAKALRRLLESAEVKTSCALVASRFRGVDPFAAACAAVEELGARRGLTGDRRTVPEGAA
jgi:UDP:flavonoid glycosyltransferase YjiC (YdhE family)